MIKTKLINIIKDAIEKSASDIHFTQKDSDILVQLRIKNTMLPKTIIKRKEYEQLIAYIKFHASMDLTQPMQPQSGGLVIEDGDDILSCRVSILPTAKFQSLVLRIINTKTRKNLAQIPLFLNNVDLLKQIAQAEAGLVLIGGPTSSGKTTTAHAIIDYLKNELDKSVITIKDPIEYQQPDIVQMQVGESYKHEQTNYTPIADTPPTPSLKKLTTKANKATKINKNNEDTEMNYEAVIKEILRHDPDVIFISEICDANTAKQAVRAAFNNHLVVSTIHSKDNLGTIYRMMDLGISAIDLSQAVVGLANQRLIEAKTGRRALFEICSSENLKNTVEQVIAGKVVDIAYTTIDEEFLKYKSDSE